MAIQIERIQNDIELINQFNATPAKGVTRLTFSEEYRGAISHVVEELKKLDAKISYCQGGNIKARLAGTDDHGAAVISAEMENYRVRSPGDVPMLKSIILDDISQALSCEDFMQAATLLAVIRHFIETHPDNPSSQSS